MSSSYDTQLALRGSLVPCDLPSISTKDEANVLNAIAALKKLSKAIQPHLQEHGLPLTSSDEEMWKDGIFKWFTFLFDHYDPPFKSSFPSRWETISYVSCVLRNFIEQGRELVSNDGTNLLAVRLWAVTDFDYERSQYSLYCGWWAPLIALLTAASNVRDYIRSIYGVGSASGEKSLVALILKRMKSSTEISNCSNQQYANLATILVGLNPHCLSSEFTKHICGTVVSTVVFMSIQAKDLTPTGRFGLPLARAALPYFSVISRLTDTSSVEAVREVTRSRALSAFIRFAPMFNAILKISTDELKTKSAILDVSKLLLDFIPSHYMIYRSVTMALHRSLKNLETTMESQTMPFKADWMKFRAKLSEHVRFMDTGAPRLIFCDNPKHDIYSNSKALQVFECSGCNSAWYCSEKCQKENWADGHRIACRQLHMNRKLYGDSCILGKQDFRSACRCAILYVKGQWKNLKAQYLDKLSSYVVVVDFSRAVYPHIDLVSKQYHSAPSTPYITNPTVIKCSIPAGAYKETITIVGDMEDANDAYDVNGKPWITGRLHMIREPSLSRYRR